MIDTQSLFTISQAAHVCGVSRSTLMRLEDRGLLTPYYVNPKSGRRYYDPYNITKVLQVIKLHGMGFSNEDIRSYYASTGEAVSMLTKLQERMHFLRQCLEEMR